MATCVSRETQRSIDDDGDDDDNTNNDDDKNDDDDSRLHENSVR